MPQTALSPVLELYGISTRSTEPVDWTAVAASEHCPYLGRRCVKVRKSEPEKTIGTCSVLYGKQARPIVICPLRLLERRQAFLDCVPLLTMHEPGNQLHIVPEVSIPGGSVDYFLVSAGGRVVRDFVGLELQTLDTTGTVWPERQRLLKEKGVEYVVSPHKNKGYGMNWKMTAKTILMQLHHKVDTFENLGKHLVLVIQDQFMNNIRREFQFEHVTGVRIGDSVHMHTYRLTETNNGAFQLEFVDRHSTDSNGIALSLGLLASPNVELEQIVKMLEEKISDASLFSLATVP